MKIILSFIIFFALSWKYLLFTLEAAWIDKWIDVWPFIGSITRNFKYFAIAITISFFYSRELFLLNLLLLLLCFIGAIGAGGGDNRWVPIFQSILLLGYYLSTLILLYEQYYNKVTANID